jgi:hypothetical protein
MGGELDDARPMPANPCTPATDLGEPHRPIAGEFNRMDRYMNDERIEVRVTSSGQTLQVVVLNKGLDMIEIVLGEGVHNVRCKLTPTRNGAAYVGNAMGREVVYERSREQVKADLARAAGFRDFKR